MKKLTWIILLVLLGTNINAQSLRASLADKYYHNFQFHAAAQVYEKIYASEPNNTEVVEKLIHCYTRLNNLKKAGNWWALFIKSDSANTDKILSYAHVLAANNKHYMAEEWLQKAYKIKKDDNILKWINTYGNLSRFYVDSSLYSIQKAHFNSDYSDFGASFFQGGVVFCSARDNGKILKYKYDYNNTWFTDLYYVKDSISAPTLFSKRLNAKFHEGPMVFNARQDTIYFTRNQIKGKNNGGKNGVNNLKIYYAAIQGGKWGKAIEHPLNNNGFSVGHPAFISENTMIFSSDMPGGFGGTDLYKSTKVSGVWQAPVNLGREINTTGNEMFPVVDENGVLYFASNGHPGLGGLDVFYTSESGGKFLPVQNMGYPVNSPKDDFGLIIKNNEGYFSSNRNGDETNDNIYKVKINRTKAIKIQANDESGSPLSDVGVLVAHLGKDAHLDIKDSPLVYVWEYKKLDNMVFSKTGYDDLTFDFNMLDFHKIKHNDLISVTLKKKPVPIVEPVKVVSAAPKIFKAIDLGQIVELDIKYDVNSTKINKEAADKLDVLVSFMKEHQNLRVELGSHSDSRGSAELNQSLSQKRAESAVDYISSKGIEKDRMIAIGYGKNQLKIQDAKNEDEHRQNRRTTIKIIE